MAQEDPGIEEGLVFGDPPVVKTCPAWLSDDLPTAAATCKYCGTNRPVTA